MKEISLDQAYVPKYPWIKLMYRNILSVPIEKTECTAPDFLRGRKQCMMRGIHLCFTLFPLLPLTAIALDSITSTQSITNGQTLVSSGEAFELGFFTPGDSQKWYVGIWYKKISDRDRIVWVANRDNPLTNSSGVLKIGDKGNLVLLDQAANIIIWASNQTKAINPVGKLLDSGNLVLQEENDEDYLWQSFDYPTDTLLPEMKLGWDLNRGLNRYLTSWKSDEDPSSGDFSFKLDQHGSPEPFLWRERERIYRTGPWNGATLSGVPEMKPTNTTDFVRFDLITNQNEVYYSFVMRKKSMVSRLIVRPFGEVQRLTWDETGKSWNRFWYAPKDQCDDYRECGTYGICDTNNSPVCKCLKGFQPNNRRAWDLRDASDGCVRNVNLDCKKDGFFRLKSVKLPDTSTVFVNETMSLEECKKECLKNCSCIAYANREISRGGTGCINWTGELLDVREYAEGEGGQDLYVRLVASELGGNRTKRVIKVVGITIGIGILICGLGICFLLKRKSLQRIRKRKTQQRGSISRSHDFLLKEAVIQSDKDNVVEVKSDELELPLFDFDTIVVATNNFSHENKLGEGGFGCVYKGVLFDHQEIAVKRLSKNSGQGMEEFKNEVRLIARLQHRNLVRLLGCCIKMDEKLLVYEHMQNKSLDSIIFNKEKCSLLDWQMRFSIICGIARGLLYLHQDSRLRIIHRDLKTSNVLLDGEMNPKISDFGMARIFGGDQTQENTRRVVGTYGYMAPEYAMDGLFSVKSDVFSFGVIVLEIVTGKKNRGFYSSDNDLNFLGHAWKLWREEKGLEMMDPSAGDSYSTYEVLRCIQVGLLCVQEHAEDRPTMSSVLLMLSSETATFSQPKLPGFCLPRFIETDSSSSKQEESCTVNQVTVTRLDGR